MDVIYDVLIIGSGPAALSAAINARIRNKTVAVLSKEHGSYKVTKAPWIENYLGFEKITGRELMEKFSEHASSSGAVFVNENVVGIYDMNGSFGILTTDAAIINAKAVVIASGSVQKAALTGEEDLLGKGVSYCATCDGPLYKNKKVAVLGYSEHSVNEANYLSELCSEVVFVPLSKGTMDSLDKLNTKINIKKGKVNHIIGADKVRQIGIDDEDIEVEAAFILRDTVPVDKLIDGLEIENGSIKTNRLMATSIKGIFAAGDCVGRPYQISKAVGEGLVAALSAADYLDSLK